MPTLYRKYRPSSFADVTGQETVVQTLQNEISLEKIAHAYLFSGPRGVGKTTLARLFAKAVSCESRENGKFEPCNQCSACTQINSGRHIDIIEVDAASQTGVDNVRENIIENAGVLPTVLKYKIFIIDEVHMLSTSAFNALLKTLEEPPAHVIFILATTELHKLPATVISRCERFSFKKIPFEKMVERLNKLCKEEKIKVEKDVLERIAHKAEGGLRDAESLLGQILSLNLKEISAKDIQIILPLSSSESLIDYLENVLQNNPSGAINLVNEKIQEGVNLDQFAQDLIETLRIVLHLQMNMDSNKITEYNEKSVKALKKISLEINSSNLVKFMDLAIKRRNEIKGTSLPQLPLELLAVEASEILNSPKVSVSLPTTINNEKIEVVKESPVPEKTISQITNTIKNAIHHISEPNKSVSTNFEQIKSKWSEVVEKVSVLAPSLTFILTMCSLQELSGNNLILGIPYSLHKEKLEQQKNKQTLESCIESVFSEKIRTSYVIVEQKTEPSNESDVTSLAAEFGGEIVG